MLPSEWRSKEQTAEFLILEWPVQRPDHLLVLPPKRFQKLLENLGNISLTDEKAARVERFIGFHTYRKSLDSYGRLPLPDEPAGSVGIGNESVLLGRMDKFEIWSPERLQASLQSPETQQAFESLASMNL
jgi:DNA-binding transcriptional regulator/RsmH inhibitor MraZ